MVQNVPLCKSVLRSLLSSYPLPPFQSREWIEVAIIDSGANYDERDGN